jgi:hypothetical protein
VIIPAAKVWKAALIVKGAATYDAGLTNLFIVIICMPKEIIRHM